MKRTRIDFAVEVTHTCEHIGEFRPARLKAELTKAVLDHFYNFGLGVVDFGSVEIARTVVDE